MSAKEWDKLPEIDEYEFNKGIFNLLYNESNSFWYNIGVRIGGPLYLPLYLWLKDRIKGKKILFHSQDGCNIYKIFEKYDGEADTHIINISNRALLLAGITEINEEISNIILSLSVGSTFCDLVEYLCISESVDYSNKEIYDHVIDENDLEMIVDFLNCNKDIILSRSALERKNVCEYLNNNGYFDEGECVHFSCDWKGTTQLLFERLYRAIGSDLNTEFYYYGIINSEQSRNNLHGLKYHTFLFDFYRNYSLHDCVIEAPDVWNIFFAPEKKVFCYENSKTVYYKEQLLCADEIKNGIVDYISEAVTLIINDDIEISPELSVSNIQRLIHYPLYIEANNIGNLKVSTLSPTKTEYIAYVDNDIIKCDRVYRNTWLKGLFGRNDIGEKLKEEYADLIGYVYPENEQSMYHLEGENTIREYHRWLRNQEIILEETETLEYNPMFSVVIPVYNTVTEQLKECIESVLEQIYLNYELILVDDHSSWDNVVPVLKEYENNDRVKVIYRTENGHISLATNDAIAASCGEYIVFMDCDDVIEKNALYEFAKLLNEHPEYDFIYSDEDKITEDGKIRHMPFFKPDWSPDLFLCMMYTNHLATYRASIVKEIGGLRTLYNGSQDYDMTLRFMEKSDNSKVGHVSKILYHWRERKESAAFSIGAKNYAAYAAKNAKLDYLKRNNIKGRIECIPGISQYRVVYDVVGNPLVSIIIPSKDHPEILKQCIDSIYRCTSYNNYEILVVDNGSNNYNKRIISEYLLGRKAKYLYNIFEFNFSKMCNIGRYNAEGEYLLFLNDDIEILQEDWIERMLGQAQQKHVGAVGAKLLYPKTTLIQHAGVSNMINGPSHDFLGCDDSHSYYFGLNWLNSDRIAVTAACMMLSADKYDNVGGFDERLPVAYNDVSLCFSLHEKRMYNVIRNDVVAYHHESLSRGYDLVNSEKKLRLEKELGRLYNRYFLLNRKDPYLSRYIFHLTSELLLLNNNDKVRISKTTDFIKGEDVVIDYIDYGNSVCVSGWSRITPELKLDGYQRYIIFADPYDQYYLAETMSVKREDVVEVYAGDESYLYSGFECKLSLDALAFNCVPHRVGVCTVYNNDKYYVTWCKNLDLKNIQPQTILSRGRLVYGKSNKHFISNCNIYWNLDEYNLQDDVFVIRGYAFLDRHDHYNYRRILLLKGNKHIYEYKVYDDSRPDVALAYPDKLFVNETGFVCRVLKEEIDVDSYELIIKFVNKYDSKDTQYINLNKSIKVVS